MNRLRLGIGVLLVAALTAGGLIGQDKDKDKDLPRVVKGTLPANWKKLGLSEDQIQMIYRIQARYNGQIEQLKAQMRQLKKDETAELEKILTKAQKDRLIEIRTGDTKDKDKVKDSDKPKEKDTPAKDKDK